MNIIEKEEILKLKIGSIVNVITDIEQLRDIRSRENLLGTKFLISDFISLIDDIGEQSLFHLVKVDLHDNTLLIKYESDKCLSAFGDNTIWIPAYLATIHSSKLPKLETITNDNLFMKWLDTATSNTEI